MVAKIPRYARAGFFCSLTLATMVFFLVLTACGGGSQLSFERGDGDDESGGIGGIPGAPTGVFTATAGSATLMSSNRHRAFIHSDTTAWQKIGAGNSHQISNPLMELGIDVVDQLAKGSGQ